ncbi:hypothetical protein HDE_02188 [Halotydeus destructor]|nr:hypothetical protein HDE_02188 [Halotydeus destructor]
MAPPHAPSVLARRASGGEVYSTASRPPSLVDHYSPVINYIDSQSVNYDPTTLLGNLGSSVPSVSESVTDDRYHLTQDYVQTVPHEIKFTKTENCSPGACMCFMLGVLLIFIGTTSGLYYTQRVFKGRLVITSGEPYLASYEDLSSVQFKKVSKKLREKFNSIFNNSNYSKIYKTTEVIAIEKARQGTDDIEVYFNVHFLWRRPEVNSADIYLVLASEIAESRRGLFRNYTIDQSSLDVTERRKDGDRGDNGQDAWATAIRFPGLLEGLVTEATPPARKCGRIGLNYCSEVLPYNETAFPNLIGHWNMTSLEKNFFYYRQIVDSECYTYAQEFVCLIAQPECLDLDHLVWPCRDFCEDFKRACANWIPDAIDETINCNEFPKKTTDHFIYESTQKRMRVRCRQKPVL